MPAVMVVLLLQTLEYQLLGADMDALALAEYLNLDQAGLDLGQYSAP